MFKTWKSILFDDDAGDGGGAPDGGAADVGGAGGEPAGGEPDGGGVAAASMPAWDDVVGSLPEDMRGSESLKGIDSVEGLVKAYIGQQPLIGADKVPVLGKDPKPEVLAEFRKKMGVPEAPDGYELPENLPEGIELSKETDQVKGFLDLAHKHNLPKAAVADILRLAAENDASVAQSLEEQNKSAANQTLESLKSNWGQAFDEKMNLALSAAADEEIGGGDDFKKWLNDTGHGNAVPIIEMLSKIGEWRSADPVKGLGYKGVRSGAMSKAEAAAKIEHMKTDKEFQERLRSRDHRVREQAIQEQSRVYAAAYPEEK